MMDTVSVKISSDAKILLDTIHQKLRSNGIRITEEKILDLLIENSDASAIKKILETRDDEAILLLKKPLHWGVADSSEDIDRYIYGTK